MPGWKSYPDTLVDEVLVVQLVFLRDVVLRELGQLDQLRHDLLLLVRVRQVHQQGDDAVGNILLSNNDHNIERYTNLQHK